MRRHNNQYTLGNDKYNQYGKRGTLIVDYPTLRKKILKTVITISSLIIFIITVIAFLTKDGIVQFKIDEELVVYNSNDTHIINNILSMDDTKVDSNGNLEVNLSILEYIELEYDLRVDIDNSINEINSDETFKDYIRFVEVNNSYSQAKIYLKSDGTDELSILTYSLLGSIINYELQIYDITTMRDNEVEVLIYDNNNSIIDNISEDDIKIFIERHK